jgi:hypothetical protein
VPCIDFLEKSERLLPIGLAAITNATWIWLSCHPWENSFLLLLPLLFENLNRSRHRWSGFLGKIRLFWKNHDLPICTRLYTSSRRADANVMVAAECPWEFVEATGGYSLKHIYSIEMGCFIRGCLPIYSTVWCQATKMRDKSTGTRLIYAQQ